MTVYLLDVNVLVAPRFRHSLSMAVPPSVSSMVKGWRYELVAASASRIACQTRCGVSGRSM
jgi:hypothetical protein